MPKTTDEISEIRLRNVFTVRRILSHQRRTGDTTNVSRCADRLLNEYLSDIERRDGVKSAPARR